MEVERFEFTFQPVDEGFGDIDVDYDSFDFSSLESDMADIPGFSDVFIEELSVDDKDMEFIFGTTDSGISVALGLEMISIDFSKKGSTLKIPDDLEAVSKVINLFYSYFRKCAEIKPNKSYFEIEIEIGKIFDVDQDSLFNFLTNDEALADGCISDFGIVSFRVNSDKIKSCLYEEKEEKRNGEVLITLYRRNSEDAPIIESSNVVQNVFEIDEKEFKAKHGANLISGDFLSVIEDIITIQRDIESYLDGKVNNYGG